MAARIGHSPISTSAGAFLLKVNREDCPNGNGNPANPVAWEGQKFISGMPRRMVDGLAIPASQTRSPAAGDRVLIWVNESHGRTGLTAMAGVDDCERQNSKLQIHVSGVSLFREPRVDS